MINNTSSGLTTAILNLHDLYLWCMELKDISLSRELTTEINSVLFSLFDLDEKISVLSDDDFISPLVDDLPD